MKQRYLILLSFSGLVLSLDQLSKHLVRRFLPIGSETEWIPGLLSVTHMHNTGFAFGLLAEAPAPLEEIFLVGIPVFALILIIMIFIRLRDDRPMTSLSLTCIFAGAIGNLVDRIKGGYVVDFIDLHLGSVVNLPTCNFADLSIVAGVLLLFYNTLVQGREPKQAI